MSKTRIITKSEIESAVVEVWQEAQTADSSRAGLLNCLDTIQELCSNVVPDVEERAAEMSSEESDDEDNFDDDEE